MINFADTHLVKPRLCISLFDIAVEDVMTKVMSCNCVVNVVVKLRRFKMVLSMR